MYELFQLGFGPFFEEQVDDGTIAARIAAEHRGAYEIWSRGGTGRARLAGRLRKGEEGAPAVGDWVVLDAEPSADRVASIERVLDRRTVLSRGSAGGASRVQIVAANLDVVFVVTGLDDDYNVRRIERAVARIWASGATPIVVLNKADLCADPAACVRQIERACPNVSAYTTSALADEGIAEVRAAIGEGVTAGLVGSSGAGKSTLVNALLGEPRMATGEVRARDGRGCHVTTRRQLALLPGGGLVLDTPGMRELKLADEDGLDAVFTDIGEVSTGCRFRDCTHTSEPGCAVGAAVERGEVPAERVEHMQKLEREARAYERRHDARLRRQDERARGKLTSQASLVARFKRGE